MNVLPVAQKFIKKMRELIAREGHGVRQVLAEIAFVPMGTVNRWMAAGDPLSPRIDQVIALLADPRGLSPEARSELVSMLAQLAGVRIVDANVTDVAPIEMQAMEVCGAGGKLAEAVRLSAAPAGPGGESRTPEEMQHVLEMARVARREADELVAKLEREMAVAGGVS